MLGVAWVKATLGLSFNYVRAALLSPNVGGDGEVVGSGRAPRTDISHGGKPMKERTIKLEFSSRQIVIVVALIALAAILLPISVQAATGSSVNIVDPSKSTYKAKVSGVGALLTGVCSWNNISTPTCATVSNHSLNTVVNGGFVNAGTDVPPLFPLQNILAITGTTADTLRTQPFDPNEEVEITSITFANLNAVDMNVIVQAHGAPGANCTGSGTGQQNIAVAYVPGHSTVHLSFPQPVVAAGDGSNAFCIDAGSFLTSPASADVRVTIVGYEF